MKKLFAASLCGLVMMSGAASAYDYTYTEEEAVSNGFESLYGGVGVGIMGGDSGEACSRLDMNCMSYKAFAGYRTSEHLAVEGGYHSLIDDRASTTGEDFNISALSLAVVGLMSVDQLGIMEGRKDIELFGKVGMAAWDRKINGVVQVSSDEKVVASDGTDFLLGGGAQMKFNENIGVRGEVEYIGGDINSTNYTAGVTYSTF